MRGVGGPLLCMSDLLSDVKEENTGATQDHAPPPDAGNDYKLPAFELPKLFQENFQELKGALEGADHCWTALTLKLTDKMKEHPMSSYLWRKYACYVSTKWERTLGKTPNSGLPERAWEARMLIAYNRRVVAHGPGSRRCSLL